MTAVATENVFLICDFFVLLYWIKGCPQIKEEGVWFKKKGVWLKKMGNFQKTL